MNCRFHVRLLHGLAVLTLALLFSTRLTYAQSSPQIQAQEAPEQRAPQVPAVDEPATYMGDLPDARPMPMPIFAPPKGTVSDPPALRGVDLMTGQPLQSPAPNRRAGESNVNPGAAGEFSTGNTTETSGAGGPSAALFTSKSLIGDPTQHPWRMNVKIFMRFSDGWYQCSGSLFGEAHVLTAGHCLNKGGSGSAGEWTSEVIVIPGYQNGNEPWGRAGAAELWGWSNWVNNSDFNGDMGWIVLNRSIGVFTGWFGYGWNSNNAFFTGNNFHNPGYPAESPYNGEQLYYWFGNYERAFSDIVEHDTNPPLSGGQSGSGAYYWDGANGRWEYAVASYTYRNSSGVRIPPSGYNRITEPKFNWMVDLEANHRPSTYDLEALGVTASPTNPIEGTSVGASVYIYNKASVGVNSSWCFDHYLSTNDFISTGDTYAGASCFSWSFGARSGVWVNFSVTIPDGVSGARYLGIILAAADANTGNNTTHGWDTELLNIRSSSVLTVSSANPNSGVAITVSPADVYGNSNGTTTFTRRYVDNTTVSLTAPATAGANVFDRWLRNGSLHSTNRATSVAFSANTTMQAVYVAPAVVQPIGQCVWNNGDGTYTGLWGYENTSGATVSISAGTNNRFSPAPEKRGQPTKFLAGVVNNQLATIFNGAALTWSVTYNGTTRSATLSSTSTPCSSNPIRPLVPTLQCLTRNGDGTFNAHLGYNNPNAFTVFVPVGVRNRFTPIPENRKQPTIFTKGNKLGILFVTFDGAATSWQLTGNSVNFSSASPRCQQLTPTLQCVVNNGNGTYTARFGSVNPNAFTVFFKKGAPNNKFSPDPAIRTGMKDRFPKGTKAYLFGITWNGTPLTWRLDGTTVTASSSSTACTSLADAPFAYQGEGEGTEEPLEDESALAETMAEDEALDAAAVPDALSAAAADPSLPTELTLGANYPNPFNPTTLISFSLPEASDVRLTVFDVLGREVAVLADGPHGAGVHQVTFDATGLPSGLYVYRLSTPHAVMTKSMLLAK